MEYRVLKDNELFLLTDQKGDIPLNHKYGLGLYKKDTRFLSEMKLTINGEEPILLKSEPGETYESTMLLTNPHIEKDEEIELWRESIEIKRHRFIHSDVLYDRITLRNYNPKKVKFTVELSLDVDFSDMFIVRGFQNGTTGKKLGVTQTANDLVFSYIGADDIKRNTRIAWNEQVNANVNDQTIQVPIELDHDEVKDLTFSILPTLAEEKVEVHDWAQAYKGLKENYKNWNESVTKISTEYKPLQNLLDRGIQDLQALSTDVGHGPFFVAGLPWFGVPFGRDSLIAALQMLPFQPEIVRGTLRTMAHYQGTKKDSWRDEEPGKIMHEVRYGELANTNQVPFTPYYGSIDSTPLFLILVAEYVHWYKDMQLFEELEPTIEAALDWIDLYGDRDGDGFIEYHQESSKGIANQGWKDSADSVVHRNGDFAESPIALAEVQGYVYQAKAGLAQVYEANNQEEKAKALCKQAESLRENFENAFWMEDKEFYAIALDKNKDQVGTLTSNPGHVLFSGMLKEERAQKVMDMLVSPAMFSGYGIRTMGEGEAAYNPISYHDGSVWPHDNSMILLGMGLLKGNEQANKVISGLIESSQSFENQRLPELFCGYSREEGTPVPYPVACSPQAWAAGTALTFVRTMLGLYPNIENNQLAIHPKLLPEMSDLSLENLPLGDGYLSLEVRQDSSGHQVDIHKNTTGFLIEKAEHVSVNA
ncbi:amylo-alpha-1,6-glucosidase [Halobacillus litoralis]|uniref:Amylo-alpha-1,6-glucosidase n=1 Tax=Halobacillus litoralis TaxID=45668 RepID=A0A845EHV2_9BACI|nr:amylo-alpha-1,6-glucosidase [Halobacillus litoralis]MYL50758.1 amylo-alpha-1,6-glucosidase [Halobacillus litoralis]